MSRNTTDQTFVSNSTNNSIIIKLWECHNYVGNVIFDIFKISTLNFIRGEDEKRKTENTYQYVMILHSWECTEYLTPVSLLFIPFPTPTDEEDEIVSWSVIYIAKLIWISYKL